MPEPRPVNIEPSNGSIMPAQCVVLDSMSVFKEQRKQDSDILLYNYFNHCPTKQKALLVTEVTANSN